MAADELKPEPIGTSLRILRLAPFKEVSDDARSQMREAHVRRKIVPLDAKPLRECVDGCVASRNQGIAGRIRISEQSNHLAIRLGSTAASFNQSNALAGASLLGPARSSTVSRSGRAAAGSKDYRSGVAFSKCFRHDRDDRCTAECENSGRYR